MFNELYDTTIARLKISAPAHLQDSVRREVQQADWPDAGGEQIIFVRKLSVAGHSRDIGKVLVNQVNSEISKIGTSENIIRFINRQEMLAALLADLASGVAATRWYWQRWRYLFGLSVSKALYSVLADNLSLFSYLTEKLADCHQLARVWQNLAKDEAKQLIHELSWKNGYPVSDKPFTPIKDTPPLSLPSRILDRWKSVLHSEHPASNRFRLAVLLIAQETVPLMLMHSADTALSSVAAVVTSATGNHYRPRLHEQGEQVGTDSSSKILQAESLPIASSTEKPKQQEEEQPINSELPDRTLHANKQGSKTTYTKKDSGQKSAENPDTVITTPAEVEQQLQIQRFSKQEVQTLLPAARRSQTQKSELPRSPSHPLKLVKIQRQSQTDLPPQFITDQGGVLYLLNFLNRSPLQTIMEEYWQQLPSGWIWLYRVAEILDFNERDPIAVFMAEQLGLDSCDDLANLPPLPDRRRIEVLADQWYGKSGVWNPSLLSLPARISYNASHIDMYSTLSHIRLDLRLAGLDINPGWLPWLGRVVQFHFDQHGGLQ